MILTHVTAAVPGARDDVRGMEPLTFGLPCPPGVVRDPSDLAISNQQGDLLPLQYAVLETWPADGSVRWVLIDSQLEVPGTYTLSLDLRGAVEHQDPIDVTEAPTGLRVSTASREYGISAGSAELFSVGGQTDEKRTVVLELTDADGALRQVQFSPATIETRGPLRTTLLVHGVIGSLQSPDARVVARLTWFAGVADVRCELAIHNPRRAIHPGGFWELGDPGSFRFRDASVVVNCGPSGPIMLSETPAQPLAPMAAPVLIHQESSGGENWQSRVHVNRHGDVPHRFRGYEVRGPGIERRGNRATPILTSGVGSALTAVAVQDFWQNFPKALEASAVALRVGLFPREAPDLHELQGGEQKTHVVALSFSGCKSPARPLEWMIHPSRVAAPAEWYCCAKAIAHLTPWANDPHRDYLSLVQSAIEGPESFENKRERIDEYGWRHFGDIYADHETAFQEGGPPYVSHYNNQYDAIGGFATQFMRSGDLRWFTSMEQLARHVIDIDVYRASGDKAAYSGGLFWHTAHYVDAGRSTHRSYPAAEAVPGGGPSNEHCYTTGLTLYYFLTGNEWAKETALDLADWILRIDDGRLTPFRWFGRGPTGLASSTFSVSYHGPGRGPGNAIVTLLNAFRLSRERRYLQKAEDLLHRCIHPDDDIAARELSNAEGRWSYTVFLQALGKYLEEKAILAELDDEYAYARASLLHYARWMVEHEYPYLENPGILEYPTETWAAQDMRKSDVLTIAARYAAPGERARLLERGRFFFTASLDWLYRFPSRSFARPVVILLSCGYLQAAAEPDGLPPMPEGSHDARFDGRRPFVPQKEVAMRRAQVAFAAFAVLLVGLLTWITA